MRGLLSAWYACIGAWNSAHSVLPSRDLAVSSSRLSLSGCRNVSKENIQNFKTWKFCTFFYFGSFLPSWIRIRIRNLNADPDPATQINADPCGSGSATLPGWKKIQIRDKHPGSARLPVPEEGSPVGWVWGRPPAVPDREMWWGRRDPSLTCLWSGLSYLFQFGLISFSKQNHTKKHAFKKIMTRIHNNVRLTYVEQEN